MSKLIDTRITQFAEAMLRWRWLILVLSLLIVTGMLSGAGKLTFSTDYRVYFGPDNPQLVAFDEVQNVYAKNDTTMFVIEPPGDDAFNPDTLRLVRDFTDQAWLLPFALRVDSISNYQHTVALDDDLQVADLVPEVDSLDAADIARIKNVAINEPLLLQRLTSSSGHVLAMAVNHQYPGDSIDEVPTTVAAARALRDAMEAKYPGHTIRMSGSNMMSNAFTEASQTDMGTLFPAMYAILAVILFLLLRSVTATLATFVVILLSAGGAMGLAGHLGIGLTSPSTIAPVVITTLAVADAVHILVSMFAGMREGQDKITALTNSLRMNFVPVMLTSVTTALGLLSINFADSPPLADLGNISAMGAILAWVLSVTLLPALVAILPIKPPQQQRSALSGRMEKFGALIARNPNRVLWGAGLFALGLTALAPLNEANDMFVRYFDERIDFRNDSDFMADNITGLYTMEFSLPAPEGVADPTYLANLEAFKQWWMEKPEVMQVSSISDIFKRLNKNMHGDDPSWYRLPKERDLAAQYLLLYEFSLPFGLDLNNTINIDKSASRFIVVFEHMKSAQTRQMASDAQAWLQQNAPEMHAYGVSPAVMFSYIAERNFQSMSVGIPLALLGISLLLILALRSLKFGLISILPNLLPMGMAFGLWALYDGEINFAMSFSMGVVLGIIVDDTIHFLSKYLRARRELGLSTEDAIAYSFRTVGTALVVTSIVLAAGFMVLSYSAFYPMVSMSLLTVMAIFSALAADFFLLPAILIKLDRSPSSSERSKETSQ
ncbi:MAG: efflux RND transporter permease subunit [Oceanococcus sp.]